MQLQAAAAGFKGKWMKLKPPERTMEMNETQQVRLDEMRGWPVFDRSGEKIGTVEEIYYDEQSNRPEFIGVGTGFFGTKRVLVPVQGASVQDDGVTVAYEKELVKDSPDIDEDELSYDSEQQLFAYYGVPDERAADYARDRESEEQSLIRSEEELRIGKQESEAGSVRLRKWVETEPVSMEVELRRETARVVREEINEPADGADAFEEQQIEVPLHAEEAVVQKQTVAKERVGIEKDVRTETETVQEELRKERIEVEHDDPEGGAR